MLIWDESRDECWAFLVSRSRYRWIAATQKGGRQLSCTSKSWRQTRHRKRITTCHTGMSATPTQALPSKRFLHVCKRIYEKSSRCVACRQVDQLSRRTHLSAREQPFGSLHTVSCRSIGRTPALRPLPVTGCNVSLCKCPHDFCIILASAVDGLGCLHNWILYWRTKRSGSPTTHHSIQQLLAPKPFP